MELDARFEPTFKVNSQCPGLFPPEASIRLRKPHTRGTKTQSQKIKIDLAGASKHHAGHVGVAVTKNAEYARGA